MIDNWQVTIYIYIIIWSEIITYITYTEYWIIANLITQLAVSYYIRSEYISARNTCQSPLISPPTPSMVTISDG